MAQIPRYFAHHPASQQMMPENGTLFHSPYSQDSLYSSQRPNSNQACSYPVNSYQGGPMQPNSPFHLPYNGQPANIHMNHMASFPSPGELRCPFYKPGISNVPKVNHHNNNFNTAAKGYSNHADELDEPLSEIPMESLLHLTKQEDELLNESEAKHERPFEASDISLGDEDLSPSVYSSSSKDFMLESDRDDEDSSSTMFSVTSTSDSIISSHSLNHNYNHSNSYLTTPNATPSCSNSPHGSANYSDSLINTPSYHSQSNNTYLKSSHSYPDKNCTFNTTSTFVTGKHPMPHQNHLTDYPHVSPQYNPEPPLTKCREIQNFLSPETCAQKLKNSDVGHGKNKARGMKKATKSDQGGPKKPKKHKVTDTVDPINNDNGSANIVKNSDQQRDQSIFSDHESDVDSPSEDNVNSQPNSQPQGKEIPLKRKRMRCPRGMKLEIKPCKVCGDKAKNMHFGGLVCDSCKAFFRRSVQSNTWDQFKCEKDENCVITKANRRCCQYCRFQKCESIGMQMEWVMTESGRMSLLKNRLARTRQMKEEKEKERVYGELPRKLSRDDALSINKILSTLHSTFGSMPYPQECYGDSICTLSNIFIYLCKRFGSFFLHITEETELCQEDKTLLLKNGISMSLYINGAHMYDPESRSWPADTTHESVKVPSLTLETLEKLASIPDAFATIMKFYDKYEKDLKDHVVAVLMYLISFFLADDPKFKDGPTIQKIQDEYIGYLKRYLIARDGYESFTGLFLKLIEGISYVKDILKFHTLVDIKPTIDHTSLKTFDKESITKYMTNLINQIETSLSGNFPPYASILNEKEKEAHGIKSKSNMLSKRGNRSVMLHHHPDTIAMFGATTRTDAIITQPLQNMIEWRQNDLGGPQSPIGFGECEPPALSLTNGDMTSIQEEGEEEEEEEERESGAIGDHQQEVDVDAVCDILKQLSHTDDTKMINIFKKNIPKELLENFSRTLSKGDP